MALTCASMAADVQALCGRTDDAVLVTTTRIAQWFNEAQRDVASRIAGLHALTFSNRTSLDFTAALRYSLGDLTAGDYTTQPVAHIYNVFYLDGLNSQKLNFVPTDEFDAQWIDPTHADSLFGKPHHWTRRGGNLEVRPVCSSDYYDKGMRVDGDFWPRDFTSGDATRYSDLSDAEEGLTAYALSKAWRAIGEADGVSGALAHAVDWSQKYEQWVDGYESRNNKMEEWDGNLYADGIE